MKRAETLSSESIHRLQPCAMINNLTGETDGRAITARTTRTNETSETYTAGSLASDTAADL